MNAPKVPTVIARASAALSTVAVDALRLAVAVDPSATNEFGAAWLAQHDYPTVDPERLAKILRSQLRRDRRHGGAHGPAHFAPLSKDVGSCVNLDDPLLHLIAFETIAGMAGVKEAIEPAQQLVAASCASNWGVSIRRAQQILRKRRFDDLGDQPGLFTREGEPC